MGAGESKLQTLIRLHEDYLEDGETNIIILEKKIGREVQLRLHMVSSQISLTRLIQDSQKQKRRVKLGSHFLFHIA